jgi:hypothetical protein
LYDALDFSTDHDDSGGQTRESLSRIPSTSAAVAGLDPARFAHQVHRGDRRDKAKEMVCARWRRMIVDGEADQKQTRSRTPGQTKKMTNVIRNVIAIATLAINDKGNVVDNVGPLR